MKKLLITSAAIAFVGTAVASNAAFAGGFLGDAINTVAPALAPLSTKNTQGWADHSTMVLTLLLA